MKSEKRRLKKIYKKNKIKKLKTKSHKRPKRTFCIYITFFIIFISLITSFTFIIRKNNKYKIYQNMNITQFIKDEINLDDNACQFIKYKLKTRTQPFEYENELIFFTSLISCKIPFSIIRFADGEEHIMRGKAINSGLDHWYYDPNNPKNKKLRESLIESSSICTKKNNFITIPCKNWITYSKSILSFSNCTSPKYMSYTTVFTNKNFQTFKNWITRFIDYPNRWKIILIANSDINKNISWAYKFFPVPDHLIDNWDQISTTLMPNLIEEAKQNELIFFVSAGAVANVIISNLIKINNKNIYIDIGSAIEILTKGYSTRSYAKKEAMYANTGCETFILKDKELIYEG